MSSAVERVCIIGSGNWGSTIAKIVGNNVFRRLEGFDSKVKMWVFEEIIEGKKLTEIINTEHINIKYLPGIRLPENVYAEPDLISSVKDATLLVFVIPHQFVRKTCETIRGHLHPNARAISLIKGVDASAKGISLISDLIASTLSIDVCVMMGANIANEVAKEQFCESTIGYRNQGNGATFKSIMETNYFLINCVPDVEGVELCGALKNIVAVAAGFVDGLGLGENTKSAIIRIGLVEMRRFSNMFRFLSGTQSFIDQSSNWETYFESCGVADLITTCFGGRNRRISELFVTSCKSFEQLEVEHLNGQKLQGPSTSKEVYEILNAKNLTTKFPLFTLVYKVAYEGFLPSKMFDVLSSVAMDENHHLPHKL